jgi:O-antigen/teichoic acid export membrane protein
MNRILVMVGLLFTVIVAVNSKELVSIFMASKWLNAAPLLAVTAWAIPAGALFGVGYMMCLAMGMGKTIFRASAWNLVLFIPIIFIARPTGLVGLAVCWTVSRYFIALSVLRDPSAKIGTNLLAVFRQLLGLGIAAVLSGGAMLLAREEILIHGHGLIRLVIVCAIGTAVFSLAAFLTDRDTVLYALRMTRGSPDPATPPGATSVATNESLLVAPIPAVDSASSVLSSSGSQGEVPLAEMAASVAPKSE